MPACLRRKYLASHLCFLALQGANKFRQGCFRPWLAGKWSAFRRRDQIARKRANNAEFAVADDARIEQRLVRDWWHAHVTSRGKRSSTRRSAT